MLELWAPICVQFSGAGCVQKRGAQNWRTFCRISTDYLVDPFRKRDNVYEWRFETGDANVSSQRCQRKPSGFVLKKVCSNVRVSVTPLGLADQRFVQFIHSADGVVGSLEVAGRQADWPNPKIAVREVQGLLKSQNSDRLDVAD